VTFELRINFEKVEKKLNLKKDYRQMYRFMITYNVVVFEAVTNFCFVFMSCSVM
jgi:hypothetical protein